MKIEKVGLMTPGDMGQAVAMQIKARGFTVCTALDKRSERSRALAREAEHDGVRSTFTRGKSRRRLLHLLRPRHGTRVRAAQP